MTLPLKRIIWLIPVFIMGVVLLVFSVQAQEEPPVFAVYYDDGGTLLPFDNNSLLDFGATLVGTPVDHILWIANEGTAPLEVFVGAMPTGFSRSATQLQIAPNYSRALTIRCDATTAGTYGNVTYLDVANLDGTFDFIFAVACTVNQPEPVLAVYYDDGGTLLPFDNNSLLDFGETPVGTPVDHILWIANEGTAPLEVFVGAMPTGFSRSATQLQIAPNYSRALTIRCNATTAGTYGNVTYLDVANLGGTFDFIFAVACAVIDREIAVYTEDGGTPVPENTTIDFGEVVVGTPVSRSFTIANEGILPLVLGSITVPSGFTLTTEPADSVDESDTTTFTVRCDAVSVGTYSGTLSIPNNDTDENPYEFTISCTVSPPAPRMVIYNPDGNPIPTTFGSYDFGTTPFGTPLDATFTIANEGTAALTWTNTTLTVVEPVQPFSPNGSLQPGGSTTFTLRCPDTVGNHSGSVTIQGVNDSSLGGFFNFSVFCTVNPLEPEIALYDGAALILSGDTVDFGATTPGTPISRTFTIANEGMGTLNIGAITVPAGFTLTAPPAASVGASTSTSFDAQCDASGEGTFGGTLLVPSDDPDENPYAFAVTCAARVQPVTPTPSHTPSPTATPDAGNPTNTQTPTATPETAASYPTPPATNTCMDHNFVADGGVRAGVAGELSGQVYCRVLVQDGRYTSYLGYDLTSAGNIGVQALVDMGIQQAVDIFSPTGPNYYPGGIVICLRGQGQLIYLNANLAPRIAEIVGSYTVPEFSGFTCITLFEPGTLVLVNALPE